MQVDHDFTPGHVSRCQITGSTDLDLVIDLGHQPPCDALLTREQLNEPEKTYPLRLMHCAESGLAQLDYVVDGSEIYPPSYPYRSGISKPLEEYQRAFADAIVYKFGVGKNELVVDIGSNDGTLLTGFKRHDCRVLGVEPTNVAQIALLENGIYTLQEFFTEPVADDIVSAYGRARIVTMTNVFAHMAPLGEVMRGVARLLDNDGVFVTESHYLLDVVNKTQFDTIYHEHIRTYSLKALVLLMPYYGMEVFDVECAERYGGNIRAYVGWRGRHTVASRVGAQLAKEAVLHEGPAVWKAFRGRVHEARDKFMEFMYCARRAGHSIAGNSCPGRAATLINYFGLRPDTIPYLGELHNSLKLDKYLPGAHIPIVSNERIAREKPDYIVLFSWHYADVIIARLRKEGLRSKLVLPLPKFKIVQL